MRRGTGARVARKPKVVVPLGNHSLEFFTGREGITTLCGVVMPCTRKGFEHLHVVPNLHPAYVLRFDHEIERFTQSMETAFKVWRGEYAERAGEGEYFILTRVDDVEEVCTAIRQDKSILAIDVETGDNTPHRDNFPRLLCVGFSNQEGVGYAVPVDHPESPWTLELPSINHIPEEVLPGKPRRGTKKYAAWEAENEMMRALESKRRLRDFESGLPKRKKERERVLTACASGWRPGGSQGRSESEI